MSIRQALPVIVPPHVARYVETMDARWQTFHPQNPDEFFNALKNAYTLFSENPWIGVDVISRTHSHLQVWPLPQRLEHIVFYQVVMNAANKPKQIHIVRVWSTHTGEAPWFVDEQQE